MIFPQQIPFIGKLAGTFHSKHCLISVARGICEMQNICIGPLYFRLVVIFNKAHGVICSSHVL